MGAGAPVDWRVGGGQVKLGFVEYSLGVAKTIKAMRSCSKCIVVG